MGEVTAANFALVASRIQEEVHSCAFVAVDVELTGLLSDTGPRGQLSLFDSPEDRYRKLLPSVSKFTVSQMGLCLFFEEPQSTGGPRLTARCYNLYLFPPTLGPLDPEFGVQPTCARFLAAHRFGFDQFFRSGVPYLNEEQESALWDHLTVGSCLTSKGLTSDALRGAIAEVSEWVVGAQEGEEMTLGGPSGLPVYELQLILRRGISTIWTEVMQPEKILIRKVSASDRQALENSPSDGCRPEAVIQDALGFTHIVRALVSAKKPLVGHNLLLDLMYIYGKFCRTLPESFAQFKMNLQELFPCIYDTKHISKVMRQELLFQRAPNLLGLYHRLERRLAELSQTVPTIHHMPSCMRYAQGDFSHEAGFDAFISGTVLLRLGQLLVCTDHGVLGPCTPGIADYLHVLDAHKNKVNLVRARVSFTGQTQRGDRPPILVVTVRRGLTVDSADVAREFSAFCSLDVRRESDRVFLLATNEWSGARKILRSYWDSPDFHVERRRYWIHSPAVDGVLRLCLSLAGTSVLLVLLRRLG